jgi:subtilisin family serine protease
VSRRLFTLFAVLALAISVLAPATGAGAAQDGDIDFAFASTTVAKSSTGSYVVVMDDVPLLVTEGKEGLRTAAAFKRAGALEESHDRVLAAAGLSARAKINTYTNALNGFSALMSHEEAQALARQPGVALVLPDEMRQLTTDSSPRFLRLDGPVAGAWARGYDGEGVVVGVIDSGIWPEHPSFADDGTYPAPPVTLADVPGHPACDFGNTAQNPLDAPFTCNNKLIGARQMLATYRSVIGADPDEYDSARDDDGHGSHTAGTAAGNRGVAASMYGRDLGEISGIAPRAHVVAYKGLGNLGGFGSDLAAAIDQAVADGVDVINYSVGGGASLTGPDDIAYLFAADAGVHVATSAGNSGPGAATIGGPASVPWLTTVGANTQNRFWQGRAVYFTHESADDYDNTLAERTRIKGASITLPVKNAPLVDAEDAGGDLCIPGELDPAVVAGAVVLCRRGAIARADKSAAVFLAGGVGMVMFNNSDDDNLFSDTHHLPSVHIDYTPGVKIKEYIDTDPRPEAKIKTGEVRRWIPKWSPEPSMTIFSSRGPNPVAMDIIKPDITGPGHQILAANSPTPDPGSVTGELFQSIAGTSMSSPHVAGVFALLVDAHPDWTPAMTRSALMTTADTAVVDNDRATQADPFDMGAGHLNPGKPNRKGSSFQPGLAYDAGFNDYLGFLCDAEPTVFADAAATCSALDAAGIPTDASDLNLPSIAVAELAGSQTVTRTVTSVAKETNKRYYKAYVEAPPGYDVEVSPKRIALRQGESATYEVTITNNGGGAIGEWAFGSLTWKEKKGRYEVRSPIAVKGSLFDAPASVDGEGVDGATGFDVTFGYTGDYAAAAHGLESAVVINDTVVQDPDQTFDPTDGFSNGHEFTTSGAAFVRFAVPPVANPDVDIDIFLLDSAGNQVASSTNGGTDELIDVVLPPDDTWTLWVHGWQTAGAPADYTLYAWVISATPGGNMMVDSAPPSAVLGATEAVEVSWTGAAAGEWHLGAVSHADAAGLIGLTLIEVDNR